MCSRRTRTLRIGIAAQMVLLIALIGRSAPVSADILYANESLQCANGDRLYSSNSNYYLMCGQTYTFALGYTYTLFWTGLNPGWDAAHDGSWSSGGGSHTSQSGVAASDAIAYMQSDGNFVLLDDSTTPSPVWATDTDGNSGAFLNAQDDANLVLYTSSNVPIWSLY